MSNEKKNEWEEDGKRSSEVARPFTQKDNSI